MSTERAHVWKIGKQRSPYFLIVSSSPGWISFSGRDVVDGLYR